MTRSLLDLSQAKVSREVLRFFSLIILFSWLFTLIVFSHGEVVSISSILLIFLPTVLPLSHWLVYLRTLLSPKLFLSQRLVFPTFHDVPSPSIHLFYIHIAWSMHTSPLFKYLIQCNVLAFSICAIIAYLSLTSSNPWNLRKLFASFPRKLIASSLDH